MHMKLLSYIVTAVLFLGIGRYMSDQKFFSSQDTLGEILEQSTGSIVVSGTVFSGTALQTLARSNTERVRSVFSQYFTVSQNKDVVQEGWLSHTITRAGYLGKIVMIQTTDFPVEFVRKFQSPEAMPIYVHSVTSKRGLKRDLYDGMAEFQFFVTQIDGINVYFIDTFNSRGCGDDELCISGVLDVIGPKDVVGTGVSITTSLPQNISLSADKKNILADGHSMFSIDHPEIIDFMTHFAALCDESNIDNNDMRRSFCTDIKVFREMTSFKSIHVSQDRQTVGFVIESETLEPDTAVGVFNVENQADSTVIFTNFYLGNDFLGFSPDGQYYMYKGFCREGNCGLTINDRSTHKLVYSVNPFVDSDTQRDVKFVKRISDKSFQYTSNGELMTATIQ